MPSRLRPQPSARSDVTDSIPNALSGRARQVSVLGSAGPGSAAFELAGAAGELLARLGITVVSGCGSPATRVARLACAMPCLYGDTG